MKATSIKKMRATEDTNETLKRLHNTESQAQPGLSHKNLAKKSPKSSRTGTALP